MTCGISICYLKTAAEMNRNGWLLAKTGGVSIPTETWCGWDSKLAATHSTKAFTLLPPPYLSHCAPHYLGGRPWRLADSRQLNAAAESGFAKGTKDFIFFFFKVLGLRCSTPSYSSSVTFGFLTMPNIRRWMESTLRAIVPPSPWWWLS